MPKVLIPEMGLFLTADLDFLGQRVIFIVITILADMGCLGIVILQVAMIAKERNLTVKVCADDATCGSPTWIGRGLTCVCFKRKGNYERICSNLTPLQASSPIHELRTQESMFFVLVLIDDMEERLTRVKRRMKANFDASRPDHQEALKALWSAAYPGEELHGLITDQWKEMGWQGRDPSTDFRGAGFISLENLLFFAKTFPTSFQRLLKKQGGKRAAWEYPFAVAGVNITFMIMQMLDLDTSKRRTFIRSVFLQILSENEWAFDLLYCVAFVVMDKQWLERNATYMEFNDILKSTRTQLERELLMDDVLRIQDMPSYSLLS
ncbi:ELMO domain [Dillenia turbinata]|uniref:ELMO domain n=1 Tax=Dillenia turbinata TaxID=194707 RepID=A0AAN8VAZ9_9MAGN